MTYRRGDFWRIDDRTGFRVRASQTRKEWTGEIVAKGDYEARHPQDFVRARRDNPRVPDPRPEPADRFQFPAGGPFFFVVSDGEDRKCLETMGGQFMVYRGRDQLTGADFPEGG